MQLIHHDNHYCFLCGYQDKDIPKSAGFRWAQDKRYWYTDDPNTAAKLLHYAHVSVRQQLESYKAQAVKNIEASRAKDSDVALPCVEGLEYLPFQRAGIAYAIPKNAVLFADEQGLGKTIQALGVINATQPKYILIVCPASLKRNWHDEAKKWLIKDYKIGIVSADCPWPDAEVYICNYDILVQPCPICRGHKKEEKKLCRTCNGTGSYTKFPQLYAMEWDMIIADECFPAGTMIQTTEGEVPIEHIVNSNKDWYVLSYNLSSNELQYKKVIRKMRRFTNEELYTIKHKTGELTSTFNHKIYIEDKGFTRESCICNADYLRTLQNNIHYTKERKENSKDYAHKMFASITYPSINRKTKGNKFSPYVTLKLKSSFKKEIERYSQKKKGKILDRIKRWERILNRTVTIALRQAHIFGHSSNIGTTNTYKNSKDKISPLTRLLQSRRKKPQFKEVEILRPKKDFSIKLSRVESNSFPEQGNKEKPFRHYRYGTEVFNLEVEDNHNYFANGVLVSNCQRIKSSKAKSTKSFLQLNGKRKLALSGTPIMNRPIEIQTTLEWLDKATWGNRFMFGKRYCNLTQNRFGWDWSGASNLNELQTRLRSSFMIRRLKADVLTELPPKFRQVIELPAEGMEGLIEQEWNAFKKYQNVLDNLKVAYQLAKASDSEDHYHNAVKQLRDGQNAAFTEMALIRKEIALTKLPYVIQHIRETLKEDHKIIVFAWHHEIVDKLIEAFDPHCIDITGRTDVNQRQDKVNKFQTDKNIHLFIGNMKAAGIGITLTASSHVVFAELDWTPAIISQAEDRAHRKGQKDNVLVQHLVLEGSLDAVMAKRIIEKQKVITKALDAPIEEEVVDIEPETEQVATAKTTRKEVIEKSVNLTPENINIIHHCLRIINSLCDGAHSLDGHGFSKIDVEIGRSLANAERLTQRMAYIGHKICSKHKRQLPEQMQEALKGMIG